MLGNPIRDRRAERREATRAEILDAAWELVTAEGLAALSLRDLARRVGMQAPSLYSYFDSKHAIYDAMFAQGAREFIEAQAQLALTGDPATDLKASVHSFVAFSTSNLSAVTLQQKDWPGAEILARDAMPLTEKLGSQSLIANNCRHLAKALVRQGKKSEALPHAQRAVEICTRLGLPGLEGARAVLRECDPDSAL